MPGKRADDKTTLSITIPRTLMHKIKKLAAFRKCTVTDIVLAVLGWEVRDISLTSEDYEAIAKEIKNAEIKRRKKR